MQSDRLILRNDQWYFKSREKTLKGPYDTMEHLQQAVDVYIQCIQAEAEFESSTKEKLKHDELMQIKH
ncbi:MAG: hypothetical protein HRU20_11630 [Pseudomonadales bacterium]|nr:hypothetical protein [Pseudomonadales bacterium]